MGLVSPSKLSSPMSEPFDPYRKWLGIPPKDQPPHHYRLLGIPAFEDDPDVIENAAARQMSHLRTLNASKHAAFAQRLLTEISAAKLCLLTRDRKSAYDERLRTELAAAGKLSASHILPPGAHQEAALSEPEAQLSPRSGSRWREDGLYESAAVVPAPVPIPMPPPPVASAVAFGMPQFAGPATAISEEVPVGVPVGVPVIRRSSSASAIRARRSRSALPLLLIFISLLVLAGAGGIALVLANRPAESPHSPNSAQPASGTTAQIKSPAATLPQAPSPNKSHPPAQPIETPSAPPESPPAAANP